MTHALFGGSGWPGSSVPVAAQCHSCGQATCIHSPDETHEACSSPGPGTHCWAASYVSLALTPRSRTSGSKGALPSPSRPASFLKLGHVYVPGPVQTPEEGRHPSNHYSKKSKLQLRADLCGGGGGGLAAALRGVNREGPGRCPRPPTPSPN